MLNCQHAASGCNYPEGECMGGCAPTTDCLPWWKETIAWIVIGGTAILAISALLDVYAELIAGLLMGGR